MAHRWRVRREPSRLRNPGSLDRQALHARLCFGTQQIGIKSREGKCGA